jgi:endonuclease G
MVMNIWRSFSPPPAGAASERVSDRLGNPAEYQDRNGYDPAFVKGVALPLPGTGEWDVAKLLPEAIHRDAQDEQELLYRNFSVKYCLSRQMPLFSAVNISGGQSDRSIPRTNVWKRDPRIDPDRQFLRKPYGDEAQGFFSRGHMTRREDPNWGPDPRQSDADTFHITNAAPQRQGFNGGLWLELENHILNNTDDQNIDVTVLTGPVLTDEDPEYSGIQIPVEFWKIVVFTHPILQAPVAIAYERSQATYLPARGRRQRSEFIFEDFQDTQVSIASLGEKTGLDMSAYLDLDVLSGSSRSSRMNVRLHSVEDAILTP